MVPLRKRARPLIVNIPASTRLLAAELAEKQGISLNRFIQQALEETVKRVELKQKKRPPDSKEIALMVENSFEPGLISRK